MRVLPLLILAVGICCLPGAARAGERFEIEPVAYADPAAAQAAWEPQFGSQPVMLAPEKTPDGKPALALPCDMAQLDERACWDRAVTLDLSRFGRIAFWVKVEGSRSAISGTNIYFNAGGGWYGSGFSLPSTGWRKIVIDRGAFRTEDSPEGWNAIKAIRISFWKGQPSKTTVYFGGLEAIASDVVLVRNSRAGKEAENSTQQTAYILKRAGIDCGTIDDLDVEAGLLKGKRIAIYPHNPKPSEKELEQLRAFIAEGGKLLACYSLPPGIAAILGLENAGWQIQKYPGQFSAMRFVAERPAGLPAEAKQASWNVTIARPAAKGARVLAWWFDQGGKETGIPAILLSDKGAFISHILLRDDPENKDRLVRALLGHFDPRVWEDVAGSAVAAVGQVSQWDKFADAETGILERAKAAGRTGAVTPELAAARAAWEKAQALLQAKRYSEVLEPAAEARRRLHAAYARCQPAREGEFRALWCHSAYGVSGLTWEEAIRRLKENGFNAVVPNMLWGGVADYPSKVLPVRASVAERGDQIALCVEAAKKHGVEVHVWKVNWNCSGAPKEFVDRMRAEGRLQKTSAGEEQPWLCPSHPENFKLELESMLEVVRNYDVDGIHFDYIRYPGSDNCFCDGCRQRFEESAGVKVEKWPQDARRGGVHYEAYQEFRRGNITRLVKAVAEGSRAIKPWVKISAAVFSTWPGCRDSVAQDWGHWVEQGYLDFVCPMNYTNYDDGYRTTVQIQRDLIAARIPFYPGVGASAPGLPVTQVIDQIQIGRAEGSDGFIIFNYAGEVAHEHVPTLGLGTTQGETTPPHNAPVIEWRVVPGSQTASGAVMPDEPVQIEATVTTRGSLREAIRSAEATVSLTALDGTPVVELGKTTAGGPAARGQVRLPAGLYRVVARGRMTLASGQTREFTARGPFVRVGMGWLDPDRAGN